MYESKRLGSPLSRHLTEFHSTDGKLESQRQDINKVSMSTDRSTADKEDSDVEVEVVGDTKKVYVYSPVFTKEDEELYRFVSSRVQDVVEEDDEDDLSGSISSTDSLEGATPRPKQVSSQSGKPGKSPVKSASKKESKLRDSLENNWGEPPRLEDVVSAIPPLELRDVETPNLADRKAEHRQKKLRKKSKPSSDNNVAPPTGAMADPTSTDFEPSGGNNVNAAFQPIPGSNQAMPSAFIPQAFAGQGPGFVYITAGPSFGRGMPLPFPFVFPNQMMPGPAFATESARQTSESDETITEQPAKPKRRHHAKEKKETRDVGEMTTPDHSASSYHHQNTMSSSTLHGSTAMQSGSGSAMYGEDDYYYEQSKKYGSESPAVTGLPWSQVQDEYGDEYYYEEDTDRTFDQDNQSKIASRPFGKDMTSAAGPVKGRQIPNNQHPPRKQPPPLPFRRRDVDYVESNKRTYGRLKGSSYGQLLEQRYEDKTVTNVIDEERARIRQKIELRAAEMRRLNKQQKDPLSRHDFLDSQIPEGEEQFYESPEAENMYGGYNMQDSYRDAYYHSEGNIESNWHANVDKLANAQEKKAVLRRANETANKASSAPTKGTTMKPNRTAPAQAQAPASSKPQNFPGSQLSAVIEESVPNRQRVNHELRTVNDPYQQPQFRGPNRAVGPIPQQQQWQQPQPQQQYQQPQHQQQWQQPQPQQQYQQPQQHQQQWQLQQQQRVMPNNHSQQRLFEDVPPAHQQFAYQPPGAPGYPGEQMYYNQQNVQQFSSNLRLSNSYSHQNLHDPRFTDQIPGNVPFDRTAVGQAADWPLMSSRQTQQYSQYGALPSALNQYNLLPPISKDGAQTDNTSNQVNTVRSQSEHGHLPDRQNFYLQNQQQQFYNRGINQNEENPGSYAANFVQQMSKVNQPLGYKPYTLRDYRQMKKEIQLLSKVGGLGPDLDSDAVRTKAERQTRRIKYAKFVEEVNKHALEPRVENTPQFAQGPSEEQIRRQKLLEYARNIPKPKVKREKAASKTPSSRILINQEPTADDGFLTFARVDHGNPGPPGPDQSAFDDLKRRHEQDKQLAYNSAGNGGRNSNRDQGADSKQPRSGVASAPKS